MSVSTAGTLPRDEPAPLAGANTLIDSVLILLSLTVVQRLVGFVRGVLFCRWLSPEELGQWDMAFGFLMMAAPIAVLGLPGSFGRYAEHYRQRGQLRTFLFRTTAFTLLLAIVAVATLVAFPERFSWLIFGASDRVDLTLLLAPALAVWIVSNYLTSLFVALRTYRVVSWLQFSGSLAFATLGVLFILVGQAGAAAVVLAFTASTALSCVLTWPSLRRTWQTLPPADQAPPPRAFWARLMPFAMWIWTTNLLWHLFENADRYMLIHYSGLAEDAALELVGQYHAARVVPLLLVGVTDLLSTMITPHLSHDWEAGRRDEVGRRLNFILKTLGLSLLTAATTILLASPLLFDWAYEGKYAAGQAVLPWVLIYCIWFGLGAVAHNYLWCAERAKLGAVALFCGLVASVLLNLLLLPRFGLQGAVLAAAGAKLLSLVLVYLFAWRCGMRIATGAWFVVLAPLALCLGTWPAVAALAVIGLGAISGERLLNREEKEQFAALLDHYVQRARRVLYVA
jgi:O-antigen/teichoic acid export membrane protein